MSNYQETYTSTRKRVNCPSKKCIARGISSDGGLFIRDGFDDYPLSEGDVNLSYGELAKKVFSYFFPDFSSEELNEAISKAYQSGNFEEDILRLSSFDEVSFLELYHGPTFAFKDMALTVLPHLLAKSKASEANHKKAMILTATSGDTGGAALSGFHSAADTQLIVLYPTDGVSPFQEKQMHYYENEHCHVYAIRGNFDDCQNLVKRVFGSGLAMKNYEFSSANSINIARLVPQIVYYFYSYFELIRQKKIRYGEKINYVVPTGNFGNILACYIAKRMGLYINKIVCASNENKVLTDFFDTGVYDRNRDFKVTDSPAMDILISSNLERLIYLASGCDEALTASYMESLKEKGRYEVNQKIRENLKDFLAVHVDNDDSLAAIRECFEERHYLIDPHTAVAYRGYELAKENLLGKTIVVSTASPYKFLGAMGKALDIEGGDEEIKESLERMSGQKAPALMDKILHSEFRKTVWAKEEMEGKLLALIGEIDEAD